MTTTPRRARRIVRSVLLALLALGAAGLVPVVLSDAGQPTVSAYFTDASPLVPGNRVQLYGVQVGEISAVTLEGGKARVDMVVDPSALPLHTDATATIMPVSLLGERFVQLARGSDAAPFAEPGAPIPVERTSAAVDVDQLLNVLDDPTSTALAALVTTAGEGLAGRGDDVAAALAALEPAMRRTDELAGVLDKQNAVLSHLVEQAEQTVGAFAPPLDGLVSTTERTLGTVAAERAVLDQVLRELPSSLEAFRRSFGTLADTADVTTENLVSLRPLTADLATTSRELREFADAATPALESAPDLLERLDRMLDEARPVVDALGPAARDLDSAAGSVRALADDLLPHDPGVASHLENLLTGAANWGMATAGYDGLGHYFKALLVPQPTVLGSVVAGNLPVGVLPANTFNPVPEDPNNRAIPGGTGLPGIPPVPRISPPQEPGNTTPAVNNGDGTDPGASGLSPAQEQSMFGQLLGGGR